MILGKFGTDIPHNGRKFLAGFRPLISTPEVRGAQNGVQAQGGSAALIMQFGENLAEQKL